MMRIYRIMVKLYYFVKELCASFAGLFQRSGNTAPLKEMPESLKEEYTLGGTIQAVQWYFNGTRPESNPTIYKKSNIDSYIRKIKSKKTFYYGDTDKWLGEALEKYPISGKSVAVIGSTAPIYESLCIHYGGSPTTIEYNKIISKDIRLKTMTVEEFDKNPVIFDAAFSISSFEHDGLGRYGDPLNPRGDIKAMEKTKNIVKRGGLLYLVVPVGIDSVVWNAHRIYGRIRLPLLLEGWKLLEVFDKDAFEVFLDKDWGKMHGAQPVFVLENIK